MKSLFAKIQKHRMWVFPVIITVALVSLTFMRMSGSSVGVYTMVFGDSTKDTNMVFGELRGVRSDEWLVTTPFVVAQANNNFERVNENIGMGQDMSIILDVPYKEWSLIFKPHNLSFFILPLEYAFAFRWWFFVYVLALATYFLVLELFKKKIARAIAVSLYVCLSPFVSWWYINVTILPLAYCFFVAILGMRLMKAKARKQRTLYTLALIYILVCFGVLLYPPFQIPCFIATLTFLLGWSLDSYAFKGTIARIRALWPYILAIVASVLTLGTALYLSRDDVIHTVQHTVYPGARVIKSGGFSLIQTMSSFMSPNLQYDLKAATGYFKNQSEASNFILIAPYLLLPSLYIVYRKWKNGGVILWGLLLTSLLFMLFMMRMHLSTPVIEPLYKLLLLDKVPHPRLLIGLGITGIFQLLFLMKALDRETFKGKELWSISLVGAITALTTMLYIGNYTINEYPIFLSSFMKMAIFSVWISISIFLILRGKFTFGLIFLILFSFASVYKVNPLYRGLGPLVDSEITKAIQSYPDDGSWAVVDDRLLINFPSAAGRDSLNSVQTYPQLELWQRFDKNRQYTDVYNRYAHVLFTNTLSDKDKFQLKSNDTFLVRFEPCDEFLQINAKYVLASSKLSSPCIHLRQTIKLPDPSKIIYIYEIE